MRETRADASRGGVRPAQRPLARGGNPRRDAVAEVDLGAMRGGDGFRRPGTPVAVGDGGGFDFRHVPRLAERVLDLDHARARNPPDRAGRCQIDHQTPGAHSPVDTVRTWSWWRSVIMS